MPRKPIPPEFKKLFVSKRRLSRTERLDAFLKTKVNGDIISTDELSALSFHAYNYCLKASGRRIGCHFEKVGNYTWRIIWK